ncbi:hypothetical protein PN466_22315 [Roseofilum reptotaenium CS-1145]|uniref:Uncharacterized protein n=1 Tax=Roseofilum reptotaenium AO1-A TaxID=1925591 RepID=A0A1L9QNH3_9CYAN|nr:MULTISPECIES: hypothetical protein [Roseofilum]MBP0027498.1 hypothetical protein [Roseofilum sp. Guam]MDB9519681.1 hypothetical protein [Roseofilum reptotaenium CS-1145]OJJ24137.1 hypothetical protein BI308_18355 [Roseofilum reptotaenium AO1-A]
MQHRILVVPPTLAQASPDAKADSPSLGLLPMIFMGLSAVLLIALVAGGIYSKLEIEKVNKKVKFEDFKNKELQKKLKLALSTITKMETNPDLVHSREFNLDYLRMRMDEEVFHFAIVNQIKVKVKEQITIALRPTQAKEGKIGESNAASPRKVSEVFDVTYETGDGATTQKRVLFRIQINMTRLPTQSTSKTIQDIIDCIETYLSPHPDPNWQPAIQGRLVNLHWDQKAKPTPLLVLEQLNEGSNVTFKTKTHAPTPPAAGRSSRSSSGRSKGKSSGSRTSSKSTGSRASASRSRSQARRSK